MRRSFLICLMLSAVLALSAQSAEEEVIRLKTSEAAGTGVESQEAGHPEHADNQENNPERKRPGSWNFSVGTSYSYMKGFGSGMGFYAAPAYTYRLTNRWSFHGGLMVSSFTPLNLQGPAPELQTPAVFNSLALFGATSYRMTDKLILHGSGTKNLVSAPVTPLTPYSMDNLSLGATYKLGHSVTIGASFSVVQGSGYHNSPFQGSTFGPPFGSPFGW